jgi:membrane protease YdiL (CAAX protease family)
MFAAEFRAFARAGVIASWGRLIGSARRFRAARWWVALAAVVSAALSGLWSEFGPAVQRMLSPSRGSETYNTLPSHPSAGTLIAAGILFVVLAPVVEEIIFRGSLQSFLGRWMPRRRCAAARRRAVRRGARRRSARI